MSPSTIGRLKRTAKIASIAAGVVSVCLAMGGAVWTASADRAAIRDRGQANQADLTDHEARLRALERELRGIGVDVRWIRASMEKDKR